MKGFTDKQWSELEEYAGEISSGQDEIADLLHECQEKINAILDKMNDARNSALWLIGNTKDQAETYYDERSEKWQEGDAGLAYQDWIQQLDAGMAVVQENVDLNVEDTVDFGEIEVMADFMSELLQRPE